MLEEYIPVKKVKKTKIVKILTSILSKSPGISTKS
jgi:hypothetical protein